MPVTDASVAHAANLLGVSEFRFFGIAHRHWFGREIGELRLEPIFVRYMLQDDIPCWVRDLARRVLARDEAGILDPGEFGIARPAATPEMRVRGQWYAVLLLVILTLFCILITGLEPY